MSLNLPPVSPHAAGCRSPALARWCTRLAPAVALGLAVLAGCGGGGSTDSRSDGSSTTPVVTANSYTEGVVNGFGSVIVNGVRFEDSSATVVDDSGALRTASSLKLGMTVSVEASSVDRSAGTGHAHRIRFGAAVQGPVEAVDPAAGTMTVLGQAVTVTDSTVFGDALPNGLDDVVADAVLQVYGVTDSATGALVATRVETVDAAVSYVLKGTVSALDTSALTLQIGSAVISYAGVTSVPSTLADGVAVRVVMTTAAVDGVWQATSLKASSTSLSGTTTEAQVRGLISVFNSSTSFTVNGLAVDASAASFPDGTDGLVLGASVEVTGTVTNGVLVATSVELNDQHRSDSRHKLRLHGTVSGLDTTALTFVVRGVTVNYASVATWTNGTVDNLVDGAKVRVIGAVGSTRTQVTASEIRFED